MSKEAEQRVLLVATAGGHLTQLNSLADRLGVNAEKALWVTVRTSQSQSMLAGRDVIWAEYGSPRDVRAFLRHLRLARRTLRNENFVMAISTGASLAPPFLLAARAKGIACHYIESATRVEGPSVSGRLVSRLPGVHVYSQYESWANGRWGYGGSIFDGWTTTERDNPPKLRRALVTVGSARGYPFERMLHAAQRALPADCEVVWQVLDSDPAGLVGRVVEELPSAELRAELARADVVISHAGTGSALTALEFGLCPVLIPRLASAGEHIDDHQLEIAHMLAGRSLAVVRSAEELTTEDLFEAAGRSSATIAGPDFHLVS